MAGRREMRCAAVGYGPFSNAGHTNLCGMAAQKGFLPWAVCDVDEARLEVAHQNFPGFETYTDLDDMLRKSDVDLVAVTLPHSLHTWAVLKCLGSGRHVVVEKPMAITVAECDRMIAAAKKSKRMLSVYHNRHWDANIQTILKHIRKIGRPYRWESHQGGHGRPRAWWRSDKEVSGGIVYDMGAHYVEWMLQAMPYAIQEVLGWRIHEVWTDTTNEDEMEAVVRFSGDAIGLHTATSLAVAGRNAIRICGTEGTILASGANVSIHAVGRAGRTVTEVPMLPRAHERYYANIRAHLFEGKPLIITPEHARRVIQVLDAACRSSESGRAVKPKYR